MELGERVFMFQRSKDSLLENIREVYRTILFAYTFDRVHLSPGSEQHR